MTFFREINSQRARLIHAITQTQGLVVVCYCAKWCRTCDGYMPVFEQLNLQFPEHVFVWIDVDADEELLDDFDPDNFPMILVQKQGQCLFFGAMEPHNSHLQRLLQALSHDSTRQPIDGPRDLAVLLKVSGQ